MGHYAAELFPDGIVAEYERIAESKRKRRAAICSIQQTRDTTKSKKIKERCATVLSMPDIYFSTAFAHLMFGVDCRFVGNVGEYTQWSGRALTNAEFKELWNNSAYTSLKL